jgi:hypothetical protein
MRFQHSLIAIPFLVCLLVSTSTRAEPPRVEKPANFVSAEEWGSKPDAIGDERRHTPKFVTLHHAGVLWTTDRDPVEFVRNMQAWGKRRPQIEQPPRNTYWPDLPYHFMIAPDGRIFEGRPVEFQPESNTKYDLDGHIGVELMGNFEQQRPSQEQVESAVALVAWLVDQHDIAVNDISTHQRVAKGQTTCPGRDFARYFESEEPQFRTWVEETLEGEEPNIDLGPPLKNGPTELITDTKPPKK